MDLRKALNDIGIVLKNYWPGNHYCTCPECSHKRKGANKKLKCLSVKIDDRGATFNCKNCGYVGARNAEYKTPGSDRKEGDQRRDRNVYGSLQRASLSRWVRRAG